MFPLGTVLLPGGRLPLHVFEPRYRQLVVDILAADGAPEFGVVLIERGSEVGGGESRTAVGTVARLLDAHVSADGRYGLMTAGIRRIRVVSWLADDPYPRADVEDWPDVVDRRDERHLADRLAALSQRLDEVWALARRTSDGLDERADQDISDDPILASYHLTALAPIGPADRQRALAAPGPRERLDLLAASLDDVEALLRFRLGES